MEEIKITFLNRKSTAFSIEKVFNLLKDHFVPQIKVYEIFAVSMYDKPQYLLMNLIHFFFSYIKHNNSHIYHITGVLHYLFFILPKDNSILTIHDCIKYHQHKGINKWIVKQLWFKLPCYFFKHITVISEYIKDELILITKCNPNKIKVIYNPLDPKIFFEEKKINVQCPIILHIGTDLNKNLDTLIESLKEIECHLIIIGKISSDILHKLKINSTKYSNLYNLSDEEIREQYRRCDIVSFVTLYEGFGLPIIEAQATGRVVITSNKEPHREIGNGGALYVNPLSILDIRTGIKKLIQDEGLREVLIKEGKKNTLRFEAKFIANQYTEYYKNIINLNK